MTFILRKKNFVLISEPIDYNNNTVNVSYYLKLTDLEIIIKRISDITWQSRDYYVRKSYFQTGSTDNRLCNNIHPHLCMSLGDLYITILLQC